MPTGPVSARSAQELALVDAGYRFGAGDGSYPFRDRGIGVPTLEAVINLSAGARVIIEMKQGDPALAQAVLAVVRRTRAADRVCVGSFYRQGLDVIRAQEPAIATSASEHEARWTLYRAWCRWPLAARAGLFGLSGSRVRRAAAGRLAGVCDTGAPRRRARGRVGG